MLGTMVQDFVIFYGESSAGGESLSRFTPQSDHLVLQSGLRGKVSAKKKKKILPADL